MSNDEILYIAGWIIMASPLLVLLQWCLAYLALAWKERGFVQLFIWGTVLIPVVAFIANCIFMPEKYKIRADLIIYPGIIGFVALNALITSMLIKGKPKAGNQA